jgi:hypothetical protein
VHVPLLKTKTVITQDEEMAGKEEGEACFYLSSFSPHPFRFFLTLTANEARSPTSFTEGRTKRGATTFCIAKEGERKEENRPRRERIPWDPRSPPLSLSLSLARALSLQT